MNARTSRLLRRVAWAAHSADPRKPKPTAQQQLNDMKQAWDRTPRPKRNTTRKGLVAVFNQLTGGTRA